MRATVNAIKNICEDGCLDTVVLKLTGLTSVSSAKWTGRLTDGSGQTVDGIMGNQVAKQVASKEIREGALLEVTNYHCTRINDVPKLILSEAEAVAEDAVPSKAAEEQPERPTAVKDEEKESVGHRASESQDAVSADADAAPPATPVSNQVAKENIPNSDRHAAKRRDVLMPTTPPSGRKAVPIAALNPYNMVWTIRAKVSNKSPMRSFVKDGQSKSILTVELVDDSGAVIEGTLWAEFADEYFDKLQEGKVYLFSNGKVKPANRRYSGVRSDYCINFDTGSRIEECADQNVSNMEAKVDYVPIDRLPNFVGKKMLVDVIGIVKEVTPLGSVKRKSDNTELQRRDVTLVDSSAKTVRLTVWGHLAESLAALETMSSPVLSVTSCRVSDFDGVSLSSLQRSTVTFGDDVSAAEGSQLRAWYDGEGASIAAAPVGEGLSSRSGLGAAKMAMLAELQNPAEGIPPPDAKPSLAICTGVVVSIAREQTLYYTATPANNFRKVTAVQGGWHCEADGKTYSEMVRRYMLLVKVADSSGEANLNVFNDEAEQLLGMSADELHELREADPGGALPALEAALWSDWTFRVTCRSKEYNGQVRQRISVTGMHRIDYAAESGRMIAELTTASS